MEGQTHLNSWKEKKNEPTFSLHEKSDTPNSKKKKKEKKKIIDTP